VRDSRAKLLVKAGRVFCKEVVVSDGKRKGDEALSPLCDRTTHSVYNSHGPHSFKFLPMEPSERDREVSPQPLPVWPSGANRLLGALPAAAYERLLPTLKPVTFPLGEIIYESHRLMEFVYFPTTSHVSLLYTMENGTTAEVGLVGNEGLVGIALFMGGDTTPNRAIVQGAGGAFQMKAKAMQEEFKRGGAFQYVLLHYTQSLISQISQTAVCNRLHSTEQRLCRWMLMTHDRTNSDELEMTHEFISHMLGIQREAVSLAAHRLQDEGTISYMRGHIKILDRDNLEKCACECYQAVKNEYQRSLLARDDLPPFPSG
jgi:CRP-like cAMP-binding protein